MNFDAYVRDKLKTYQHADLCRRDIINALTYYKELKPVQQKFVHNDGRAVDLLALEGTIPIKYKGASYHIPICIWITETSPFVPPLVYVKPTNTMAIKVSKHVDANGRVFLPFLHEWSHPRSDLSALLQIMTCVFAEDPPVYSKPARFAPQPPSQYPGNPPSYPGYPTTQSTPYPTARSSGMPMPQMPVPGGGMSSASQPPYPPYPTATTSNMPYPARPPPVSYPPVSSTYQRPTTQIPVQSSSTAGQGQSQPYSAQSSISEETIKASLMSAVDDKLRRRLKETFDYAQHEMKELEKTEDALKKGSQKLDDMLKKLENEQADVDNNIKLLTEKNDEIAVVVNKLESQTDSLQIDDAVVTTAPLYNQILNLFAEENALEDTIYYLSEGLRKEAIDLESFLKHIRSLSRKQFMTRALLHKARKTAGLKDVA